ncbi:MAG TPA: hypothetical protein VD931_17500 [Baekduia sp.]|nr:hypothetical protein [Baekduia sp.]
MDESPRPDQEPQPGTDAGANEGEMAPDRPTEDAEDIGTAAHKEAAAEQMDR